MELKITKQLCNKAVGKPCQICREVITEDEAAAGKLQATQTHRGYCFVHSRCWERELKGGNQGG